MDLKFLRDIDLDRRLIAFVSIGIVLVLALGFGVGRVTASGGESPTVAEIATESSSTTAAGSDTDGVNSTTTTSGVITGDASASLEPSSVVDLGDGTVYGTDEERETFISDLVQAGVTGGTREGILATADQVCYMLERLQTQDRTPAFAVRVVWNESLADLRSEDLAAFAFVFNSAPQYLCPESVPYGESVAYWLGY